jgi:hypothetical protein
MNKAGRLALIQGVLTAIPLHQLLVLNPSKKIFRLLQKIQRGFLWAGRSDVNGRTCHVNWQLVAWSIQLRGLGVRDMERTGLALRLRWMWFDRTDDRRAWSGMGLQFTRGTVALLRIDHDDSRQWHNSKILGRSLDTRAVH